LWRGSGHGEGRVMSRNVEARVDHAVEPCKADVVAKSPHSARAEPTTAMERVDERVHEDLSSFPGSGTSLYSVICAARRCGDGEVSKLGKLINGARVPVLPRPGPASPCAFALRLAGARPRQAAWSPARPSCPTTKRSGGVRPPVWRVLACNRCARPKEPSTTNATSGRPAEKREAMACRTFETAPHLCDRPLPIVFIFFRPTLCRVVIV